MEMIGLMHEAEPYGHLIVSGIAPTDAQLTVLTGAPPDQLSDLLGELESAGVFSRTPKGVVYSRRMTRDAKKARISRKNGKAGGNPKLCNSKENSAWVNPPDKPPDKTQRPEARGQRPDLNLFSNSETQSPDPPPAASKTRRRTSVPDGFPEKAERQKALEYWKLKNRPDICVETQADLFRSHHEGKGTLAASWSATWRTWYVNAVQFARQQRSNDPARTASSSDMSKWGRGAGL